MDFAAFRKEYEKVPVESINEFEGSIPEVSVCIQTYQQEELVRDCIEGVLSQETSFRFEILLGEDDSSDDTRNICKEYASKYPNLIRLFLHSRENNMTINGNPTGRFNFLYNILSTRGKYIALCEGDDYWKDPKKLQKQYEAMEENPDCSVCFTSSEILNVLDGRILGSEIYRPHNPAHKRKYSLEDGILHKGALMPTPSMFFIAEYLRNYPEWLNTSPMGDIPLTLYLGAKGEYLYLDEITCVYRRGVAGSWTSNMNYEKRRKTVKSLISLFQTFDEYTNFEHHSLIKKEIRKFRINDYKSVFRHTLRPVKNWILRKESPAK